MNPMYTPTISIVIPTYNAEECIDELILRLRSVLFNFDEYEIIFVEDCGSDRSWEIIKKYSENDPRIKGIKFSRNFGQHYGITAGLDKSSGLHVVVMDCDLQDRPEDIPLLYAMAKSGKDVVIAKRGKRSHHKLKIFLSNVFYSTFRYLSGMTYESEAGNFRILSRSAVNNFCEMRENLRFFGALVGWMGYEPVYVQVKHDERYAGISSYNLKKLISLAISAIIGYSDKPLTLSIKLGFFMSITSIFAALYVLYISIIDGVAVPGWASIIISLYFIGGTIVSILGILGVYIGKIFDEVKRRPLYIIEQVTGFVEK